MGTLYTSVAELKQNLGIPAGDTTEDFTLGIVIQYASDWITEILGHDPFYASRVQYYRGTGTQNLVLNNRPVDLTVNLSGTGQPMSVILNETGYFGQASGSFSTSGLATVLNIGVDYTIKPDYDNPDVSRAAVLYRIGDVWPKPQMRQRGILSPFIGQDLGSIQVIYSAGYMIADLPSQLRLAADLLAAKILWVISTGLDVGSEGYEERSLSIVAENKAWLISLVWPLLQNFINRKW